MAKELSPVQKKLLQILIKNQDDPLTVREIQKKLEFSSPSLVAYHVDQLEKRGVLRRNPDDPRDYIIQSAPAKNTLWLSQYGLAHCGPKGSILDDDPIDRIPIPARFITFSFEEAFLVEAKGDSMLPKIAEGDTVICRKCSNFVDDVIVVCVNDGEAIIKKARKEKTHKMPMLISLNDKYPPFLAAKDFRVVGEVKGVISMNIKS